MLKRKYKVRSAICLIVYLVLPILMSVILLTPAIKSNAAVVTYAVASDLALIYSGPSEESQAMAIMEQGAICRIMDDDDETYSLIFSGGFTGYIPKEKLTQEIGTLIPYKGVSFMETQKVYVRPDINSDVLCYRAKGSTEPICSETDDFVEIEVKVDNNGTTKRGYVKKDLVQITKIVKDAEPYFDEDEIVVEEDILLTNETEDERAKLKEELNAKKQEIRNQYVENYVDDIAVSVQNGSSDTWTIDETQQPTHTNSGEQLINFNNEEISVSTQQTPALPVSAAPQAVDTTTQQPAQSAYAGEVLTRQRGTIQGPSGKETYYNLNMSNIVNSIKDRGWVWADIKDEYKDNVTGDYYIREDGVKMLGDYIMVAAHLGVHPRGSLVETSLGTGVVVDTGTFAKTNSQQIDIAVNW